MEILNNFGFQPVLFTAQVVNFLIIFIIMKKFLYKPLLKVLNERKQKIEESLKNAEESNRLMKETIEKEQEILKNAQIEAKKLLNDAKIKHDALLLQTETDTKILVEKMVQDARNQISLDAALTEKRLTHDVTKIAAQMLTESLAGFFKPEDQEAIIKNALKNLRKKAD